MTCLRFCRTVFVALLLACVAFSPRPILAASAVSRGAAGDIADLNRILARAAPGQPSVFVGDMGFQTDALRQYRACLADRLAGRAVPHSSFLPAVRKWPGGAVFYAFDSNVSAANQSAFVAACHDWEQVANVHFAPRSNQANYVLVHSQQYNNSYVGMIGGPQDLNLYNFNYEFIICHELGHALGLIHEHERSDRDTYITVNLANVTSGMEANFDIVPGSLNQGAYDFDSVMHYGPTAFSSDGQPTMTVNAPYAAQFGSAIGQYDHLSVSDKAGMSAIYGPPAPVVPLTVPLARMLWSASDGTASLWNVDAAGGFTHQEAGPYAGWNARSLAVGADGNARLLWAHADGAASLWTVGATGQAASQGFGPYDGWTAQTLAVGPDNLVRLLWTRLDGTASLWLPEASGAFVSLSYGPFPGWTARALAVGPDSQAHLLWTRTDGMASLWTADASGGFAHTECGPYAGWSARSLAAGSDGLFHLLWTRTDGAMALWTGSVGSGFATRVYGPYAGWTADAVSVGSDNAVHALWHHTSGTASLWNMDSAGAVGSFQFGPYNGWQAIGLAGK